MTSNDGSMTECPEGAESPFGMVRVQRLIAAIILLAVAWMAISSSPSKTASSLPDFSSASIEIELNSAETKELSLLPGVGPILAERIVADRSERGNFGSIDDLGRVYGIGPKLLERFRQYCYVRTTPPDDRIAVGQ